MPYLELSLWAVANLLSYFGYGHLLLRSLNCKRMPVGLNGTLGVCFTLAVGGVLNLLGWVRPAVLVCFVLLGAGLALIFAFQQRRSLVEHSKGIKDWMRRHPGSSVQAGVILLLLAIPVVGNIRGSAFAGVDDPNAYFAFPKQMLQLGSLSADPYSERRLESSLGGGYFLQALMLVVGDVRSIPFADVSVGYLLLACILLSAARALKLSGTQSIAVLWLLVLVQFGRMNSTMVILPAALFASTFLLEISPELDGAGLSAANWRRSLLLGLTFGAICTLKSNCLPAALVACCSFFAIAWLAGVRNAWRHLFACMAILGGVLLPWMLDMKAKEGTLLYPLLGHGNHVSIYNKTLVPAGATALLMRNPHFWAVIAFFGLPFLVFFGIFFVHAIRSASAVSVSLSSLLLAVFLGVVALDIAVGADSVARYTTSFLIPTLLLLGIVVLSWGSNSEHRRRVRLLKGAVFCYVFCIAVFFGANRDRGIGVYFRDIHPSNGMVLPLDMNAVVAQGKALQSSVPPHARVFSRLMWSFPFDFRRNTIYIADWPGMSSPPPGMPLGQGPESLRRYLLGQGIRYVFFNYAVRNDPPPTAGGFAAAIARVPPAHHWLGVQGEVMHDVQDNLAALGQQYRRLYDDGSVFALDLLCDRTAASCPPAGSIGH